MVSLNPHCASVDYILAERCLVTNLSLWLAQWLLIWSLVTQVKFEEEKTFCKSNTRPYQERSAPGAYNN